VLRLTPAASVRRPRELRPEPPVMRLPAPPVILPSFLTSMWISSPRPGALVAHDGFVADAAQLAHPDALSLGPPVVVGGSVRGVAKNEE
jgi:hypothetical protein